MSACPMVGAYDDPHDGKHVGLMFDWKDGSMQVVHQCDNCEGVIWWEPAKEPAALLAKFGLSRIEAGGKPDA